MEAMAKSYQNSTGDGCQGFGPLAEQLQKGTENFVRF